MRDVSKIPPVDYNTCWVCSKPMKPFCEYPNIVVRFCSKKCRDEHHFRQRLMNMRVIDMIRKDPKA